MAAVVLLDHAGQWQQALVCERRMRQVLRPLGVRLGRGAPPARGALRLLQPAQPRLCYLACDAGWLAVLCDAGEWLALPRTLAVHAPEDLPALPQQDALVDELLEQLGEQAEG